MILVGAALFNSSNQMNGASPIQPHQGTAFAGLKIKTPDKLLLQTYNLLLQQCYASFLYRGWQYSDTFAKRHSRYMQQHSVNLSLILPCFNAKAVLQQQLPVVLSFLENNFTSYEVILVDDGSEANEAIAVLAKQYKCKCVTLPQNMGKGAALRNGFIAAVGKVQVFLDADIPFELDVLLQIFQLIDKGQADVAIGDRTAAESVYYLQVSWLRKVGSFFISGIAKRLLRNNITDTQCGVKGFSAAAAAQLFPASIINGFGIDVELLYLASGQGMAIKKVPVKLRASNPSSVKIIRDGMRLIFDIFKAVKYHGRNKI